ncbi:hypothetical protein [Nocardia sp. NBC_00416]|uniref:hypothetical protein n=1 Tax=Nocardia sp. NBC_00416 TaxID=2975991 RepID=UPI002E1C293A
MDEAQAFELLLLDNELGIPDPELDRLATRLRELCEPELLDELMAVYEPEVWKLFKLRTPEYLVTDDDVAETSAGIHARLPSDTDPAIISAIEACLSRSAKVITDIIRDGTDESRP